jgi:hypothetical protein
MCRSSSWYHCSLVQHLPQTVPFRGNYTKEKKRIITTITIIIIIIIVIKNNKIIKYSPAGQARGRGGLTSSKH